MSTLERPPSAPRRRRYVRAALLGAAVATLLAPAAALRVRTELRASLPVLDGALQMPELSAPVSIARDALGVPWIRGESREDVARATGFVHAQDRFFQMDLARRRAAGELAALVGARALPLDREIRIHRFRAEAAHAVSRLTPHDAAVLSAYTGGVNAGLRALGSRPFEYLVLQQQPQPWREEDTLLVVLSMFVILQDPEGAREATLSTMHDVLPAAMFEFLDPPGSGWDAPLVGPAFAVPPIPAADVYDLRARRAGKPPVEAPAPQESRAVPPAARLARGSDASVDMWAAGAAQAEAFLGSNNWAVSGARTADGGALLANDMHLAIRVPNTWYRAALEWRDAAAPDGRRLLVGVTLPGVPAMVVGSNTHVAWGFTNTFADWSDIVLLEVDPQNPARYRTPDGWRAFEIHDEAISVAGGADERLPVAWTIWGPVLGPDHRGRHRAYRWVAHDADRLARSIMPLTDAVSIEDAFDAVNGLGTPGQNFVVADERGRIGWTVYGALPRREGLDGRLPASWADGSRGWNGWLDPAEYPRIADPPSGRIWTANNRVVDGEMLRTLGDGGYEVGSRATIIRDRLMARERFTRDDMLAIQLDASTTFLARWRELILSTMTARATTTSARRSFRAIVEREWPGTATPDSVAYRLTRSFRERVSADVMTFLLSECFEADREFDYRMLRRREATVWAVVTQKPRHLLDPQFDTWQDFLLSAVDAVIAEADGLFSSDLRALTWSRYNLIAYRHPLSASVPLIGRWLDMPEYPMPGDLFTPRMHWGAAGASERLIVSPGREADGMLHMPTGQSGHPLSEFYGSSHRAWAEGTPTPLLPGSAVHTVRLVP